MGFLRLVRWEACTLDAIIGAWGQVRHFDCMACCNENTRRGNDFQDILLPTICTARLLPVRSTRKHINFPHGKLQYS